MNHKAIYKLYPQVVTVDDTAGAFDAQGNKVEIDLNSVNAWVDPEAYIAKRAAEYPPITDFADAYYWAQKGKTELMDAYVAKCDAIKQKYPKGVK
jgi:uncharacterized lipoprotein NlpE involved in copper resistance